MPLYVISKLTKYGWEPKFATDDITDFGENDRIWFGQLLRTEGARHLKVGDTMYDVMNDNATGYGDAKADVMRKLTRCKADKL